MSLMLRVLGIFGCGEKEKINIFILKHQKEQPPKHIINKFEGKSEFNSLVAGKYLFD